MSHNPRRHAGSPTVARQNSDARGFDAILSEPEVSASGASSKLTAAASRRRSFTSAVCGCRSEVAHVIGIPAKSNINATANRPPLRKVNCVLQIILYTFTLPAIYLIPSCVNQILYIDPFPKDFMWSLKAYLLANLLPQFMTAHPTVS